MCMWVIHESLYKDMRTVKRKLTIKVCPSPNTFCVSLRETHGSMKNLNSLSKSMCFSFKVQLVGRMGVGSQLLAVVVFQMYQCRQI